MSASALRRDVVRAERTISLATAAIVLLPYATLALPLPAAHRTQAVLLTATLGIVLGVGWLGARGANLAAAPPPLLQGAALYLAAGVLGGLVGWARGNPRSLIAGQLLAIGLLPLAALAGCSLRSRLIWRPVPRALALAATVAVAIHLAYFAASAARGELAARLIFPNAVSLVAASLMALLAALAWRPAAGSGWLRRVAVAAIGLYIVGSGTRGLWLVTPVGLLAYLLLSRSRPPAAWRRPVAAAAVVLALACGAWWWAQRVCREGPELVSSLGREPAAAAADRRMHLRWTSSAAEQTRSMAGPVAVASGASYHLRASVRGAVSGRGWLAVRWLDARGRELGRFRAATEPGAAAHWIHGFGRAPGGTVQAEIVAGCATCPGEGWSLADLSLRRTGPVALAALVEEGSYVRARARSIFAELRPGGAALRRGGGGRLAESLRLLELFRRAPWPTRLLGHGLGARYAFPGFEVGPTGAWARSPHSHFIHNFYLFLLYKLGLAGSALALAGLGLVVAYTLAAARRAPSGARRDFLAAVAAAWVAYLAWSVVEPQILNFRSAPLWGLLVAATGAADRRPARTTE